MILLIYASFRTSTRKPRLRTGAFYVRRPLFCLSQHLTEILLIGYTQRMQYKLTPPDTMNEIRQRIIFWADTHIVDEEEPVFPLWDNRAHAVSRWVYTLSFWDFRTTTTNPMKIEHYPITKLHLMDTETVVSWAVNVWSDHCLQKEQRTRLQNNRAYFGECMRGFVLATQAIFRPPPLFHGLVLSSDQQQQTLQETLLQPRQ